MSIVLLHFEEVKTSLVIMNCRFSTGYTAISLSIISWKDCIIKLEKDTYGTPTRFGYELLRDHVLPSILGTHEERYPYIGLGKELARKFPIFSFDELSSFFAEAGWGLLLIDKTIKKRSLFISLKR